MKIRGRKYWLISKKFKGMKNLILFVLFMALFSCGTQKQLQRDFVGKPVSALGKTFGQPKTVIEKNDSKIYIFEKEEELKSTEIDQGRLTLDPIVTPKVVKTERYIFTVKDSVVQSVRMEEEYER